MCAHFNRIILHTLARISIMIIVWLHILSDGMMLSPQYIVTHWIPHTQRFVNTLLYYSFKYYHKIASSEDIYKFWLSAMMNSMVRAPNIFITYFMFLFSILTFWSIVNIFGYKYFIGKLFIRNNKKKMVKIKDPLVYGT